MIEPATPVDELLRLETLRNLKILDTDPEERFDRITRLAKRLFGTPIALVSLVDAQRQWFKSRQGLDATETPREVSFCGHAILEEDVMVVSDAHADERFCDNPLVTSDPSIRFYAGYPLSAPDGRKVGTLCVIDREPRDMDDEDLELLEELGRMVEEELVVADMMKNDPVTGLSNRSGFTMIAEHVLATCTRNRVSASLLMFHFSNLSLIDDSLGRSESDRAAIEFTQLLMATFRDSDIVGRIEDDVFAVLLAGSAVEGADSVRERLQARVQERNDNCGFGFEFELESCAVDYDPGAHSDAEEFLQAAELAMVASEMPTVANEDEYDDEIASA